jgi:putative ABC transport system substrate-binding protein
MLTRRRILTSLAAACAAASPSFGQTDKTLRLGAIASGGPMAADSPLGKILLGALADLGYAPGRNLVFAARGAMADLAKLPALIEELRAAGSEILVALGYPSAAAAKAADVPTVIFAGAGDPVATGLVESWAHPGGVITGISDVASTLTIKRLELLKAFSPQLKRVAMLWNTDDRAMTLRYQASAATAQTQGLIVQPLGVREPDDFNGAFAAMDRDKPDAILMVADALTVLNRKRVFDYAAAHRLPAIYESDFFAREGGLMSYGADQGESLTRAASMVDRIFKGARPADIPFEQPTRYLFVINLRTAKAMGLEPPVTLLGLADDVIE